MAVFIESAFAHKIGEALVQVYNEHQGQQTGAVRLVAYKSLYSDLTKLDQTHLIATAIKPMDYPNKMWWGTNN